MVERTIDVRISVTRGADTNTKMFATFASVHVLTAKMDPSMFTKQVDMLVIHQISSLTGMIDAISATTVGIQR
jgi:hypothetical protein